MGIYKSCNRLKNYVNLEQDEKNGSAFSRLEIQVNNWRAFLIGQIPSFVSGNWEKKGVGRKWVNRTGATNSWPPRGLSRNTTPKSTNSKNLSASTVQKRVNETGMASMARRKFRRAYRDQISPAPLDETSFSRLVDTDPGYSGGEEFSVFE